MRLISLQHAEATGSGSCPVVARRLVGPAIYPLGETQCGLLIPPPVLERLLRDIDHGAGQRAADFAAVGCVPDLEHRDSKALREDPCLASL